MTNVYYLPGTDRPIRERVERARQRALDSLEQAIGAIVVVSREPGCGDLAALASRCAENRDRLIACNPTAAEAPPVLEDIAAALRAVSACLNPPPPRST
jgi:hypothetical protein